MDPFEQMAASAVALTEEYSLPRELLSIEIVDAIIARLCASGRCDRQSIIAAFGAWLGQQLVNEGGRWVNTEETTAPRVQLAGCYYSPFDAIANRCIDDSSQPSIKIKFFNAINHAKEQDAKDKHADATEVNQAAWEKLATTGRFVASAPQRLSNERAMLGLDPWLRKIGVKAKRVLCLAAGGGTHAPLLAMAGADVTVVDFCDAILNVDRECAAALALPIRTVCCDMQDLSVLNTQQFDIVVQPVSNNYVRDPSIVYAEIHRALLPGGWYLSQNKSPTALQVGYCRSLNNYVLTLGQPEEAASNTVEIPWLKEPEMREFGHSHADLIGKLCEIGFTIHGFEEPNHADAWASPGSLEHVAQFVPPYFKLLARRE